MGKSIPKHGGPGRAAVAEMAAYIDLNPVRAGIVEDPKYYRWRQYGASLGGGESEVKARDGVKTVVESYNHLKDEETVNCNRVHTEGLCLIVTRCGG